MNKDIQPVNLYSQIAELLQNARKNVVRTVNQTYPQENEFRNFEDGLLMICPDLVDDFAA